MTFAPIEYEPNDYSEGGETGAGEAAGRDQHPDDAALAEVRTWLDGLNDEAQVQFKVRKLRGVLNLLDGWERAARGAADQRNAAYTELDAAKVDMRLLREDVAAATERAVKAEAEAKRLRATVADEHGQLSHLLDNAEGVARLAAELVDAREANVLLRDGSKKLRAELDKCAGLNLNLVNESAELVVERDQARTELAELRDEYANLQTEASQIADRAGRYRQEARKLRTDFLDVTTELVELRERIGEERVEWGVRLTDDDGAEIAEDEDDARWKVGFRNSGFTTIAPHCVVKRVVGEWKAVGDEA